MGSNKTNSLEPCTQGEELCHYHGYIKNENQSSAAISTCGGLVSYLLKLLCVNKLSYENWIWSFQRKSGKQFKKSIIDCFSLWKLNH